MSKDTVRIQKVLNTYFSDTKFIWSSRTYCNINTIVISWTNGPTQGEVEKAIKELKLNRDVVYSRTKNKHILTEVTNNAV